MLSWILAPQEGLPSMPQPKPCQTADFFVLRSPTLPADALAAGTDLPTQLRERVQRGLVGEALALASPDLAAQVAPWLAGELETAAARRVTRALLRYLGRMSQRATPFGLFAGISLGTWGPASALAVAAGEACRKAVRLDWGVLERLAARLEREPAVRAALRYRPNTSLYPCGGWVRYLERRDAPDGGRTYHLEAVEATPHLAAALRLSETGEPLRPLAARLAKACAVGPAEAEAYLHQLVDAQVLVSELAPAPTEADPLGRMADRLQADPATAPLAVPVVALREALARIAAAPPGGLPEGPARGLPALEPLAEARDLLQVDLVRPPLAPVPGLTLSPAVRRALEAGVETLRRLTPPPAEGPLDRFQSAFQARYGDRWVPLLEVLDEEGGLGFDGAPALEGPLLEGLPLDPAPPLPRLTRWDLRLLAHLPDWQGREVWELDEAVLADLAHPDPPAFPAAFAALATLSAPDAAALDRGEFSFWMAQHSGPTAARWLGRFAGADPALETALRRHLAAEESLQPEAIFAEVVHVPEGRTGNVLARPALRACEIPFLAAPGVPDDRVLPPSDLRVTVRGGRVLLASARLGREVVPRLSSAHNFTRGPAVYRFLARLQDQDGRPGGWSWGALAGLPFLPRVVHGRHVLSKAQWRIEARDLGAPQGTAWDVVQALRARRGLPRFVELTDADNSLRVDLDAPLWVETLHHLVARRAAFTLTECFPAAGFSPVASPEGPVAHELVIPFEAPDPGTPRPRPDLASHAAPRLHAPGSEWLYLKLYGGPARADQVLAGLVPLLTETRALGLWDRWHFVRYRDPEPHLRLRFHGAPGPLLAELLPRCHRHLAQALDLGLLWKWQVDSFEPEYERYGGPLGFGLAEAWFGEDSQWVLGQIAAGLPPEHRWRVGLRRVDAIWAAAGLDVPARQALAEATRTGLRRELGDPGPAEVELGQRFRGWRRDLAEGFPAAEGTYGEGLRGLRPWREALDQGRWAGHRAAQAGSLAHMHLNRLLRERPREQEWALMALLVRLYDSALARSRPMGRSTVREE